MTQKQFERFTPSMGHKMDQNIILKVREAAKKVLLLMAGPLRGGGVKGRPLRK